MVKFVIGDYKPKPNEVIIDNFIPACIFRTKMGEQRPLVIFAEYVGLTKEDCLGMAKAATMDITIVMQSNRLIKGLRQGKNVKVEYNNDTASTNIFEVAAAVVKISDRDYVFEFLKHNKPQMYMLVKALIAAYDKINNNNKQVIAWLDMHQWKVDPLILYAVMAYKIKNQDVFRLPWKFPKKVKE